MQPSDYQNLQTFVEQAWQDRSLLTSPEHINAIEQTVAQLDAGRLRVAYPPTEGTDWQVLEWVKKAVILYFPLQKMEVLESGIFEYHDKIALKRDYKARGIRVVPPAVARYGSFIASGVVLMPSYINIGAYVGSGTMVDTWATVGSCAQIGEDVHLSGGVGIGGVLEPLQAKPVIVEDGAFVGSRAILVEGVHIGAQAVIGAGVVLTGSSRIIDVSQSEPLEYKGYVPPRSVVIPGSYPKTFPAGIYHVPCSLIIGQRHAGTDLKTSLNQVLREHQIVV